MLASVHHVSPHLTISFKHPDSPRFCANSVKCCTTTTTTTTTETEASRRVTVKNGNDSLDICRVLNGMWQTSGGWGRIDRDSAVDAMLCYADAGLCTFDMADHYGPAEDLYGIFINRVRRERPPDFLEKVRGLTKWVPPPVKMTSNYVRESINLSRKRMDVSSLDMLQFHWWDYSNPGYLDALKHLTDLKEEGKIKTVALTNFDTERLQIILENEIPVVSNQHSIVDMRPQQKMAELCQLTGVKLITYGTVMGGLLSEKFLDTNLAIPFAGPPLNTPSLQKYKRMVDAWGGWSLFQILLQTLKTIASKHGVSIPVVAVRYTLDQIVAVQKRSSCVIDLDCCFLFSVKAMAQDTGMFMVNQTIGTVLCCKCGIPMQPNAANMCVKCLRSEVDITAGLQKHVIIKHCPECDSYLQPPRTWIKAQLESKELLTFCVKRLKLNTVTLVHAEFVWTEPHSKRIKVRLRVQKEVLNGAILEQAYIVEYVQQDHMCESCSRIQANPDQWVAAVQLRQHVSHRRTFFYLEQLILKHDAAAHAIKIKQMDQGVDFFFTNRSHGVKFVEFVGKVAPVRSRSDKQLVSHDPKSNNYNYKYTFSVEISPIGREDLICLPPKVALNLGNLGPLVICTKVTNSIALLDPLTLRHCFLDADQYWRTSFKSLLTSRQLVKYIVLDIEIISPEVNVGGSRYALADAQVARLSDFGKNDNIFFIKTHLGHLLKPGDHALGYDLYGANSNDMELDKYKGLVLPEAILIKKSYEEKRQRKQGKPRSWKLKSLNMEVDDTRGRVNQEQMNTEYEEFLRDLEENPMLRFDMSLYRNKEYQPSEMASMTDGEDIPSVPLEELLADLDISDAEDEDVGMRD